MDTATISNSSGTTLEKNSFYKERHVLYSMVKNLTQKVKFEGFVFWHDGSAINFDLKQINVQNVVALGNPFLVQLPFDTDYRSSTVTDQAVFNTLGKYDQLRIIRGEITNYSLGTGDMLGKAPKDGVRYPIQLYGQETHSRKNSLEKV